MRSPSLAGLSFHLVGIGGAGMSGAARMLAALGARVAGSDQSSFEGLGELVASGMRVTVGHSASNVDSSADLIVHSAAVSDDNPEIVAGRKSGIPVVKYARLLGLLMERWTGVAIAGTHGKSTTTSMTAYAMRQAGLDPSYVVGASCNQLGHSSAVGRGSHFVVESCEYDRSFLHLAPKYAAILNIEPDHLDCYGDFESVVEAFGEFGKRTPEDGLLVFHGEDQAARRAAKHANAALETFGLAADTDWTATRLACERGCYSFEIMHRGQRLASVALKLPGLHNVLNALAATALACHAGGDPELVGEALTSFEGVQRRMTWRGEGRGITIVDDYAHHPTEIRVTLEAARFRYQPRRTWVVFQPHQSTRTRQFLEEFAGSFDAVEEVIVPDIFGARENDGGEETACAEALVSRITSLGGCARYSPSFDAAVEHIEKHVADGDLVLTMGAGDVWKVADELVARIC